MAHHHHQQQPEEDNNNPKFLLDTLYCSEEHWEEEEEEEEEQEEDYIDDSTILKSPHPSTFLVEADMFWDNEELTSLLAKQEQNPLCTCPQLEGARLPAVDWMLKVSLHYSFSALTVLLAVNYLDRFLFTFRFQNDKPWITHLASVTCLSLAAKVEETQVPLLLDLQVEESRYLFEAKTIKKMEILVLSTLGWKMNPITPLSFVDYSIRRLGLKDHHLCCEFLNRCESLLLSVIRDSRFMSYLPSVLATATMMQVVVNNNFEPWLGVEKQSQIMEGIVGINKEQVDECCKVMLEYCEEQGKQCMKRKFESNNIIPGSPNGVMDVSFSCDSNSNDSWAVSANSISSSSQEPLLKKIRTTTTTHQDQLLLHPCNLENLTS